MAGNVISYKKKSKETFKKPKSLISLYKFGPRLQKSTEISKKPSLNRDLLNLLIGLVCFGWYLVNPHAKAVQNMFGKGV